MRCLYRRECLRKCCLASGLRRSRCGACCPVALLPLSQNTLIAGARIPAPLLERSRVAAGQSYEFDSDSCGVVASVQARKMAPLQLLRPLAVLPPVPAPVQRVPGLPELRVQSGPIAFVVRRALFLQRRFREGGFLKRRVVRPMLTARPVFRSFRTDCALPSAKSPGAIASRLCPSSVAPRFSPASWCAHVSAPSPDIEDSPESCWSPSHVHPRSSAGGRRARRVLARRLGPQRRSLPRAV